MGAKHSKAHEGAHWCGYSPIDTNMRYVAAKLNVLDKIRIMSLPEEPMKLYSVFSKHKKNLSIQILRKDMMRPLSTYREKNYIKKSFPAITLSSHHWMERGLMHASSYALWSYLPIGNNR